jgi:molybdopterin/thiamine biosynthesis adenylyltransferase
MRIPFFDSAFGINHSDGKITEAGGRVALISPGGPCLLCYKDIDVREAGYDLASPSERELAKERGYIAGSDIIQPSVVSLDGIIASVAATEFLALTTGFRTPVQYSCYYMLSGELRPIKNRVIGSCLHHIYENGRLEDIMRYCV